MQLPFTHTNGTAFDADELMANLEVLRDGLDQIRNSNIVANAGIDKSKLAHSGAVHHNSFNLVDATSNGSLDTAADAGFTLPTAFQMKHKTRIRLATGQVAALCAIDVEPEEIVVGGSDYPEIQILIDGVQFMGQSVSLEVSQALYNFGLTSPIANPGYPIADNSVIEYYLRRSGGGGSPTIRGVSVTEHIKSDLVAM